MSATPAWHRSAACVDADPDLFFPPKGGASANFYNAGKRICAVCPVRDECLQHALDHDGAFPAGLFGGLTPKERKRLRRAS